MSLLLSQNKMCLCSPLFSSFLGASLKSFINSVSEKNCFLAVVKFLQLYLVKRMIRVFFFFAVAEMSISYNSLAPILNRWPFWRLLPFVLTIHCYFFQSYCQNKIGSTYKRPLFAPILHQLLKLVYSMWTFIHHIIHPQTPSVSVSSSEKVSAGTNVIRIYTQGVRLTFDRLSQAFILRFYISTNWVICQTFV